MHFFSRLSLLWKILLGTSVSLTLLFGLTAWIVLAHTANSTAATIEAEASASFKAYDSLWRSREQRLASVSRVLAAMSDVRAAFSTADQATIRDTAGELWKKVSEENAIFVVTDPAGRAIASLGGQLHQDRQQFDVVRLAAAEFPRQVTGFMQLDGELYQVVVTPVYLDTARGSALWNVLVAGFRVDRVAVEALQQATGGSDFVFSAGGRIVASTLPADAAHRIVQAAPHGRTGRMTDLGTEYATLGATLTDVQHNPVGQLVILRSFGAAVERVRELRRQIVVVWLVAIFAGLLITYYTARRIVRPLHVLVAAAGEVAKQNYESEVPVESEDELGMLARAFNAMCESIRSAREELIRQERILTIGRMSSSIVHDLRNPLAAIYAGSEMLNEAELPPAQVKRLSGSIYRASRTMQQLLQDLLDMSRQKTGRLELCRLLDLAESACESLAGSAEKQRVEIAINIPENLELPLERARVERVFLNLIGNALQVMPAGGRVTIDAVVEDGNAVVRVRDTGPGVPAAIRGQLFKPFATSGKKNGLGLGLALARQAALDHGGDMWVEHPAAGGACFAFRLPVNRTGSPALLASTA